MVGAEVDMYTSVKNRVFWHDMRRAGMVIGIGKVLAVHQRPCVSKIYANISLRHLHKRTVHGLNTYAIIQKLEEIIVKKTAKENSYKFRKLRLTN